MVTPQAELDSLFFHDPNHPARKLVFMNPEEADSIIKVSWALACTGKFIWPIPDKGLRKRTHRIAAPTLIIWGRDDKLIPLSFAERFHQEIANSQLRIIDNCGHMPQVECPNEFANAVLQFFSDAK